mmetsp:Transcript_121837/g.316241  ORF Transcript_121837/g.316241 Transcript_121837/m.316241 type:complete len:1066 (+) Transcript_121837:133-3330(+)
MGKAVVESLHEGPAKEVGPPLQGAAAESGSHTKSTLEALQRYALRLAEARTESAASVRFSPSRQEQAKQGEDALRQEDQAHEAQRCLQSACSLGNSGSCPSAAALIEGQEFDHAEDSDGECIQLCKHCRLPLGREIGYSGTEDLVEDGRNCDRLLVHKECFAERMAQGLQRKEDQRLHREAQLKRDRRLEFDIGWSPSLSLTGACAARSKHGVARRGMSCLVLQGPGSVRVAQTEEPAGAVNLEYLGLALRVRRLEGREPIFSLDPVDPTRLPGHVEGSMLMKRFEPEWLAGTSVGEVLFQADYHLKELSMGEHDQPVVGMKDCFHLADEIGDDKEWSAREWFVVRRAQLEISEDNVLLPSVKLGVEAREQFLGTEGLEDAPLTRPSHPLVRYAEAFSHNFDLIAERKSVIYHLREVAKASVLAKYLLEGGVELKEHWFDLLDRSGAACCLEVPQLWSERCGAEVQVQDDAIVERQREGRKPRRVYGGVDFGVSSFRLSAPRRVAASVLARTAAPSGGASRLSSAGLSSASVGRVAPQPMVLPQQQKRLARPRRVATRTFEQGAIGPSTSVLQQVQEGQMLSRTPTQRLTSGGLLTVRGMTPEGVPLAAGALDARHGRHDTSLLQRVKLGEDLHGVDLSLNSFNLSAPTRSAQSVQLDLLSEDTFVELDANGEEGEHGLTLGEAFCLDLTVEGPHGCLGEEDRQLFRRVFHPSLTDRCLLEGRRFAPPPAISRYLSDLRRLVDEEDQVRNRRRELFFSLDFVESDPGPLFPPSWRPSFEVASALPRSCSKLTSLGLDNWSRSSEVSRALRCAAPAFDKSTEDGTRFRIYRFGGLEVRACSKPEWGAASSASARRSDDVIAIADVGALFAVAGREGCLSAPSPSPSRAALSDSDCLVRVTEFVEACSGGGELGYHSYVTLKTEQGHTIVTEKLEDGSVSWMENPEGIEFRNLLAKVIRSEDCSGALRNVLDMRRLCFMESRLAAGGQGASTSRRKLFAWTLFCRALGAHRSAPISGFLNVGSRAGMTDHSNEVGRWQRKLLRRKAAHQQEGRAEECGEAAQSRPSG